jgi:exonuclease 3'-5' domain-containing protein 2
MARKRHTINRKYSNCKIYHPSGKLMCVNSEKKGRWYVEKTGAKVLSRKDDGTLAEIQLTFEPKGFGYDEDDVFGLSIQETRCVVSGETDIKKLTKHHIVPISYRRHFPLEYKSRNHHDVVYITEDLHDDYERIGDQFRVELAKKYGTMTYNEATEYFTKMMDTPEVKRMRKVKGYLTAMTDCPDDLPESRYSDMVTLVLSYIKDIYAVETAEITEYWSERVLNDIIIELDRLRDKYRVDPYKDLIEKVGDIDTFVKIWRQHFVDTMKPQFLPKGWSVNYKTKVDI